MWLCVSQIETISSCVISQCLWVPLSHFLSWFITHFILVSHIRRVCLCSLTFSHQISCNVLRLLRNKAQRWLSAVTQETLRKVHSNWLFTAPVEFMLFVLRQSISQLFPCDYGSLSNLYDCTQNRVHFQGHCNPVCVFPGSFYSDIDRKYY